jgi:hypothetical protein
MRLAIVPLFLGVVCVLACGAQAPQTSFADRRDVWATGSAVAAGDVNNDGNQDLVAGIGELFSVELGNGDGTFRPGASFYVAPYGVFSFLLVDINKDGKLDILFAAASGVGLCYGNGDGTFQAPLFYAIPATEDNQAIVVGDFNGDGILDAATPGKSGIWILLGTPGGFSAPQLLPVTKMFTGAIGAADLNGDGKLDLVAVGGPGILVLLGNGNGTFGSPRGYPVPTGLFNFALADFNRDGHIDIATVTINSADASILLGNGDGTFKPAATAYLPGGLSVVAGDINGDGIPDLITQGVFIALGKGDGTFQKPTFHQVAAQATSAGSTATQVVLADLRNLHRLDIVTANNLSQTLSVLLNNGHGKFIDGEYLRAGGIPQCEAAADFNGDGKSDLAFGNGQGVTILLGTGKANPAYSLPGTQISLPGGYCVAVADFNHDGFQDLVVIGTTLPNAGTMAIFLGQGNGTFTAGQTFNLNVQPGYPLVGDFNGDGKLDIAISGNLLAFGNGDGTFQTPAPFIPDPGSYPNFTYLTAADLNGDGSLDIVTSDFVHGTIFVLLNQGNGTFTQSTFGTLVQCGSPSATQLADLNGDGRPDLAVLCSTGNFTIYFGNGNGTFRPGKIVTGGWVLGTGNLLIADLNGDGKPDLAALGDHSLYVLTGNGDGTFNTPVLFGVGSDPAFTTTSYLHGKPASSGMPDVVVTDRTGSILVLLNTTR